MQLKGLTWLIVWVIGLSTVQSQLFCGDGVVDIDESCDDGDMVDFDGCTNCTVDLLFNCELNATGTNSICEQVLLDLNVLDGSTLDYTNEYLDLDEHVFLSDPNSTNMTAFQTLNGSWDRVLVVILEAESMIDDEEVDVFTREAFNLGRTDGEFTGQFLRSRLSGPSDPRLMGLDIDASLVVDGMQVTADEFTGGDTILDEMEIEALLNSIAYIARAHPGFNRRDYCIIAVEGTVNTAACIGLYFIGRNDDPPTVTYTASGTVSFTEGQSDFVPVIDGELLVTDPDHPTRYLMQSAQARIRDFVEGFAEWVSVTQPNPDFTYEFDDVTGTLTITGNATTDVYAALLENITYLNTMTEPVGSRRYIELTVFDGIFTSNAATVEVAIINTNDEPFVSLVGDAPGVQELTFDYTEGDGPELITPQLVVVDTDPTAMIQRVMVSLTPLDGEMERLFLQITAGLQLALSTHVLELTGLAAPSVYTAALRTLTYEHQDGRPGNPTTNQPRTVVFVVEDDQNTENLQNSFLTLNIIPVNDPPILLFISDDAQRASPDPVQLGLITAVFEYIEDDPAINIGADVYLRDVDSNITSATITASGLVNGVSDAVFVSGSLLEQYSLVISSVASNGGETREVTITGEAAPSAYEEVLRTLHYQNALTNNSVMNGNRDVEVTVQDSGGLQPAQPVLMIVTVMNHNDGPAIDLGVGEDQNFNVTFVENGDSVPIALAHLLDIMDEEGHDISMMTIELTATNGQLDPSDTIFVRTPLPEQIFQSLLQNPPTRTVISISLTGPVSLYIETLRNIYYDNDELEPTYFNDPATNATLLNREIVIRTTDNNLGDQTTSEIRVRVQIQLQNDNRPRIIIDSDPASCSEDCRDLEEGEKTVIRRRRDVKTTPTKRRRRMAVDVGDYDNSMAPQINSVAASVTNTPNDSSSVCIENITVNFDPTTNTPIVELQHRVEQLLTFDLPELSSALKYGMWLDRATLVVLFPECVRWEGRTASGRERPIYLIFENSRDLCDWSSPCVSGVCFSNSTGCPTTGFYQVELPAPPHSPSAPSPSPTSSSGPADSELLCYNIKLCVFVTLAVACFAAIGVAISCRFSRRCSKTLPKSSFLSTCKPNAATPPTPLQKIATSSPAVAVEMTPPTKDHVQELIHATLVPEKSTPSNVKTSNDDESIFEATTTKLSSPSFKTSPVKAVSPSGRGNNSKLTPNKRGQGGKLKKVPPAKEKGGDEGKGESAIEVPEAPQREGSTAALLLQRECDEAGSPQLAVETVHASAEQSGRHAHQDSRKSCDHHVANSNQSVSQREQFNERSNDSSSLLHRRSQPSSPSQCPH